MQCSSFTVMLKKATVLPRFLFYVYLVCNDPPPPHPKKKKKQHIASNIPPSK